MLLASHGSLDTISTCLAAPAPAADSLIRPGLPACSSASQSGGGRSLYAGIWGNLVGVAPASAIFMAVYEPTKQVNTADKPLLGYCQLMLRPAAAVLLPHAGCHSCCSCNCLPLPLLLLLLLLLPPLLLLVLLLLLLLLVLLLLLLLLLLNNRLISLPLRSL